MVCNVQWSWKVPRGENMEIQVSTYHPYWINPRCNSFLKMWNSNDRNFRFQTWLACGLQILSCYCVKSAAQCMRVQRLGIIFYKIDTSAGVFSSALNLLVSSILCPFYMYFIVHTRTYWFCSKANAAEKAMVAGLGGLNLFGVIILGNLLK